MHPSDALPDSGNYMLRSGLGADAVNLRFHCGSMGSGHGHADTLHVSLNADGEDILVDAGRYTYVDSPLRLSLKSPAGHNVTLLDGQPFTECTATWEYDRIAPKRQGTAQIYAASGLRQRRCIWAIPARSSRAKSSSCAPGYSCSSTLSMRPAATRRSSASTLIPTASCR